MKAVKVAIDLLDHLDPILGYDLAWVAEGAYPDANARQATIIRAEILDRAKIHGPGTLRNAWRGAASALDLVIDSYRREGA